jgi:hypothetical protein
MKGRAVHGGTRTEYEGGLAMRKLLAALAAISLGITLGSGTWAQDKNREQKETIRGVVAGVTAEGEMAIDYRTNKAVLVEAANLTIVGSPVEGQGHASNVSPKPDDSERRDKGQERGNHPGKQRDNVYVVWISPETKVYEASGDSGRSEQDKPVSLDRLEVGDPVMIELNRLEETDAHVAASQTDQMRRTHGRNRIVHGDASVITILPAKKEHGSPSGSEKPTNNR